MRFVLRYVVYSTRDIAALIAELVLTAGPNRLLKAVALVQAKRGFFVEFCYLRWYTVVSAVNLSSMLAMPLIHDYHAMVRSNGGVATALYDFFPSKLHPDV